MTATTYPYGPPHIPLTPDELAAYDALPKPGEVDPAYASLVAFGLALTLQELAEQAERDEEAA